MNAASTIASRRRAARKRRKAVRRVKALGAVSKRDAVLYITSLYNKVVVKLDEIKAMVMEQLTEGDALAGEGEQSWAWIDAGGVDDVVQFYNEQFALYVLAWVASDRFPIDDDMMTAFPKYLDLLVPDDFEGVVRSMLLRFRKTSAGDKIEFFHKVFQCQRMRRGMMGNLHPSCFTPLRKLLIF
ncbi:hypothetical protein H2201_003218 [Coniosporium apollinis]|uniref:Uncharacterized protein n=1 Tax=Coniosporium apollinis TaxID=61459 RepID=A0ABQ9NVZ8_9PEZI|nr:hypothetical protein H2201_003218 [Coniosporium apollinis]